jgi:LmbE family N-acetylglucosaminyl deacetylase
MKWGRTIPRISHRMTSPVPKFSESRCQCINMCITDETCKAEKKGSGAKFSNSYSESQSQAGVQLAKAKSSEWSFRRCAVIVAHPDDETLWSGGIILTHPESDWTIVTLCRKSDPDRAPKFFKALEGFNAVGAMGDLDDGPEQSPLDSREVQDTIIKLLPSHTFELIITHGPMGEYTRHLRHEETGRAVLALIENERLFAGEVWRFAYEDGGRQYLPRPAEDADLNIKLPDEIWQKKYDVITKIYGFSEGSFEAKTTPRIEAFNVYKLPVSKRE